jgi:hypothetical protein
MSMIASSGSRAESALEALGRSPNAATSYPARVSAST